MTEKQYSNGHFCKIDQTWIEESQDTLDKVAETHKMMLNIHEDTKYLKYLADMSKDIQELKSKFLDALLGKNIVPLEIHKDLLDGQRASYVTIIKWFCASFAAIITAILAVFKYLH